MMTVRLSKETVGLLPTTVKSSNYARAFVPSVVHFGAGAFHRAHQAAYFDALMDRTEDNWMIENLSMRSAKSIEQLQPQNGLFILRENSVSGSETKLIRSINRLTHAAENPKLAVDALSRIETELVTLTITEKGYKDSGSKSAAHLIAQGLQVRRQNGLPGITVLSCDNLRDNGEVTRRAVLDAASMIDQSLPTWIERETAFPSSMVDRITPAITNVCKDKIENELGLRDEGVVQTEAFAQWVIEDKFCGNKPELERVGVQFTSNVEAWETIKLRLLNGAHSSIAYLGGLAGHKYVHEAIADPTLRTFVNRLWDEMAPTLPSVSGFILDDYRIALLERFENPSLFHRTSQIAIDGSQKIPQRLIAPLMERNAMGKSSPAIAIALAAWMKWQSGVTDTGETFPVDDPMADTLRAEYTRGAREPKLIVSNFLDLSSIFPLKLRNTEQSVSQLVTSLESLLSKGVLATISLSM